MLVEHVSVKWSFSLRQEEKKKYISYPSVAVLLLNIVLDMFPVVSPEKQIDPPYSQLHWEKIHKSMDTREELTI
jgi:hypothetical protein